MKPPYRPEPGTIGLAMLGGPLHRLSSRMGMANEGSRLIAFGLALGIGAWIVLVALATIDGVLDRIFSLSVIAGHVRLLLVVPLLFACEAYFAPRAAEFVQTIVKSGLVSQDKEAALRAEIGRINRWTSSWLSDGVCLLVGGLFCILTFTLDLPGSTTSYGWGARGTSMHATGWWYWVVCLTLFRFLVARWIWRIGVWSYFLWRLRRLELRLIPTHPDRAGGIGYLEVVHAQLMLLVFGISAIQAASFAEEWCAGLTEWGAIYGLVLMVLAINAALFLGPLLIFTGSLVACRREGLLNYMELAAHYVGDFREKWLTPGSPSKEPFLGTPDLQSLADLSNSIQVVDEMRVVPISLRLLTTLVIAALLPMAPLLLLQYPVTDLASELVKRLFGL